MSQTRITIGRRTEPTIVSLYDLVDSLGILVPRIILLGNPGRDVQGDSVSSRRLCEHPRPPKRS